MLNKSRKMKFRFWNTEDNYYSNSNSLSITGEGVVLFAGHQIRGRKYKAEQWTGLTDKNGVEIYEGDIVQLSAHGKTREKEVFFEGGGFYPFAEQSGQYVGFWLKDALADGNYEVIGNIHEHKHLLEH